MHVNLVGHRTFRLVGASFALHCSVPNDNIKLQGDWKSTAYDRYLDNALRYKLEAIKQMSQGITHYLPYLSLGGLKGMSILFFISLLISSLQSFNISKHV